MKKLYPATRDEWRNWLNENHAKKKEIWLVYYKPHVNKPTLKYDESVEEALCYGWIDSIIKKIDDEKYARKFTPRKDDSRWSESNKKRAREMIVQSRMTKYGMAKIEAAKISELWEKPDRPQINLELPADLKIALAKNNMAKEFFNRLAPSYQKQYIAWIQVAKRPETRAMRVKESIELLQKGEKLRMK
jgi:uncharacterized protein YdeI (YjbR/CyaY-like superfamily)